MPTQVLLERLKVVAQTALSPQMAHDIELRSALDYMADHLLVQLRSEILKYPIGRIVYSFPATPWDCWKQKWLPKLGRWGRWYLRRHPVRESAVAFSAAAIWPQSSFIPPKSFGPVAFYLAPEGPRG